jgi:hypothetical protein
MAQTRRNRKLARWGRETWARERRLDEVPAEGLRRIELPADAVGADEPRFDPQAAALAVTLHDLRRRLGRWRWIPWRRRQRPELERLIGELSRQRAELRSRSRRPEPRP